MKWLEKSKAEELEIMHIALQNYVHDLHSQFLEGGNIPNVSVYEVMTNIIFASRIAGAIENELSNKKEGGVE